MAVLAVIVAVAALGAVAANATTAQRDSTLQTALQVNRRAADGVAFLDKTLEDAALDSARAKACLGTQFCDSLQTRAATYQDKSVEFMNETPFYNKIASFSISCSDVTPPTSTEWSYAVTTTGEYTAWAGNASAALAKKTLQTNRQWTLNLTKAGPPFTAKIRKQNAQPTAYPAFACS